MPSVKMKTHKGTKKRFKVTATGKVVHKRCGSSHLNSHMSGKRIRKLRKPVVLRNKAVAAKLRRAMQRREAGHGRFASALAAAALAHEAAEQGDQAEPAAE
ncbi:50S ribosomal protein L35 [Tautonia plasticadhaerens]|uniref:Large ribosomal subunit protein bL35 n=1 Tax=Tautonia plasticadhaerens TaxID=2527974 RepID=A0A518GXI4_9BACT|nr:50S ribosomal protein L35 [Tautonia plasticadhaerens]QDV33295.1 50S ribosomal protein L35 [Tautonia plasticadhaerens]